MAEPIGYISALYGTATAASPAGTRMLSEGDDVYEDDVIATMRDASLEIRFQDKTILAQGESSTVFLDEYFFEENSGDGGLLFKLAQGSFRAITGDIVHNNPDNFTLVSPLATIGIRGTTTASIIPPPDAQDHTEQHLVLVYDGKAVVITPKADGTFRLLTASGEKIDVSELVTSDVQLMTQAEFRYFQQFSPEGMQQQAPIFDSPNQIRSYDPSTGAPVDPQDLSEAAQDDAEATEKAKDNVNGQDNQANDNQADDNKADENQADETFDADPVADVDADEFDQGGEGEVDQETGEASTETLVGGAQDDLLGASSATLTLEGGTVLNVTASSTAAAILAVILAPPLVADPIVLVADDGLPDEAAQEDEEPNSTYNHTSDGSTWNMSNLGTDISNVVLGNTANATNITSIGVNTNNDDIVTINGSALTTSELSFDGSSVTGNGYYNVTGGTQNDSITGTNHNTNGDVIYGGDGGDTLRGLGGHDTLYGQGGNDDIAGGTGNDTLYGGAGMDKIRPEDGIDTVYGDAGNDTIYSSVGADTVNGGAGTDTFYYSGSNTAVNVTLGASSGNTGGHAQGDVLTSIETLYGSSSHGDTLTGSSNAETIYGQGGNDTIEGKDGADTLYGGDGDDTFNYAQDCDIQASEKIYGDSGTDTIALTGTNQTYTFTDVTISTIENLSIAAQSTASFTDDHLSQMLTWSISGNAATSTVETLQITNRTAGTLNLASMSTPTSWIGGEDIILLQGSSGNDTITGSFHDDTVIGGDGADTLSGGAGGSDTLSFESETGGNGINYDLDDTAATDTYGNVDSILLSTFENLTGSTYNDTGLNGTTGANILSGLAGNDTLNGDAGNDTLYGGSGSDTLTGGTGNDVFYYADKHNQNDIITDFTSADDTIRVEKGGFALGGTISGTHWHFETGAVGGWTPANSEGTFLFDNVTGSLYFDANGSTDGQLYTIANIGTATMDVTDIEVIAV